MTTAERIKLFLLDNGRSSAVTIRSALGIQHEEVYEHLAALDAVQRVQIKISFKNKNHMPVREWEAV